MLISDLREHDTTQHVDKPPEGPAGRALAAPPPPRPDAKSSRASLLRSTDP